ncbi:MAG: hypothetical protein JO010_00725, partial [Alphaproteobacteria bacterium]|nr:hypothetical protein [Alphaproteobacteria bacterium]
MRRRRVAFLGLLPLVIGAAAAQPAVTAGAQSVVIDGVSLSAQATLAAPGQLTGSGRIVTQERQVGAVAEVSIEGAFAVTIAAGRA